MLEDGRYSFAKKRVELNLTGSTPAFGFEYEYDLPIDYLLALEEKNNYAFEREGDVILSDESTISLLYIYDNDDPATYSGAFIEAFYIKLALAGAYEITGSANKEASLGSELGIAEQIAMGTSSREGTANKIITPNTFINVRK